ncbi:unnamed protein product [Camellia sinensis]
MVDGLSDQSRLWPTKTRRRRDRTTHPLSLSLLGLLKQAFRLKRMNEDRTLEFHEMTLLKRYVLRLFISLKYITANVVDRDNGRIVATSSTVEHAVKSTLECGRTCNAKSAAVVGEVLAMRLKVYGLERGQGRGIHVDVNKEIEKKGFKNRTKIFAIVNALKSNGVKLILDDDDDNSTPPPSY